MEKSRMTIGFAAFLAFLAYSPNVVMAHCPLCTAGTVAVVAATRLYGLDDLVVGTFIGGLVISTVFWTHKVLLKRNKGKVYMPNQFTIILVASILMTVVTFYYAGLLGSAVAKYQLFGVDKILVGSIIGTAVSLIAPKVNTFIRSFNKDKNYVPMQLLFVTLGLLSLAVFGFYLAGLF